MDTTVETLEPVKVKEKTSVWYLLLILINLIVGIIGGVFIHQPKVDEMNSLIRNCEKDLPRSQNCKIIAVSIPKKYVSENPVEVFAVPEPKEVK